MEKPDRTPDAPSDPPEQRRQPYQTPRVYRLGTLTEITATVGGTGMGDGGNMTDPGMKTGLP